MDLLNVTASRKQFWFRFENTWLEEPSFRKEVSDFWLTLPAVPILPKLLSITSFMARWGRNFFRKFHDKITQQRRSLQLLVDRIDVAGLKQYFEEKNKLDELLWHEEIYRKQRAKTFCLTEGDANTIFSCHCID